MRYSRNLAFSLLLMALAACDRSAGGRLAIKTAQLGGDARAPTLRADIAFAPSAAQRRALDHGVPLGLRLRLSGRGGERELRLRLRYFPLSQRYQLRVLPAGTDASYALRAYLLDALERLRLPLADNPCAGGGTCRLSVEMDYQVLPGALRLPAMLHQDWRVPAAHYAWQPGPA